MTDTDDMDGLRAILFQTIRDVRAGTIDLGQAKAVSDLSGRLLESQKVVHEHMRLTESHDLPGLLPAPGAASPRPAPPGPRRPAGPHLVPSLGTRGAP